MAKELIIDDDNWRQFANYNVDGRMMGKGLVERNYDQHPVGTYAAKWDPKVPLIPRSEWSDRIKEMERTKSRLSDLRMIANRSRHIPSLDQNGQGYCWAYSTTSAIMLLRAAQGLPYVRLSAHAVGCMVKGFRDQGGWSAQSLEFITARGVPSVEFWAEKSMSRSHNNDRTWENAARHKPTEGWVELDAPVYDRDLTFDEVMTCLLNRIPVPSDFNWWTHAVCGMDPVEVERNSFGIRIWNSWRDSWGNLGTAVLRGSKAVPDNAVAPRVVRSAA